MLFEVFFYEGRMLRDGDFRGVANHGHSDGPVKIGTLIGTAIHKDCNARVCFQVLKLAGRFGSHEVEIFQIIAGVESDQTRIWLPRALGGKHAEVLRFEQVSEFLPDCFGVIHGDHQILG